VRQGLRLLIFRRFWRTGAQVDGKVHDALANITNYDDFLKVLESVVKADQDVLLHTIVDEGEGADLFAFMGAFYDGFAYEPISQALAEYCPNRFPQSKYLGRLR
jgi:hypothetical protein